MHIEPMSIDIGLREIAATRCKLTDTRCKLPLKFRKTFTITNLRNSDDAVPRRLRTWRAS
jgi:hypothetical protein